MFSSKYKKRRYAYKLGYFAEILVIIILVFKCYKIVRHRYASHLGEIDIIAIRKNVITFIEVKARSNCEALSESISLKKRNRIFRSARAFIAQYPKAAHYDQQFIGYLVSWRKIEVVYLYDF